MIKNMISEHQKTASSLDALTLISPPPTPGCRDDLFGSSLTFTTLANTHTATIITTATSSHTITPIKDIIVSTPTSSPIHASRTCDDRQDSRFLNIPNFIKTETVLTKQEVIDDTYSQSSLISAARWPSLESSSCPSQPAGALNQFFPSPVSSPEDSKSSFILDHLPTASLPPVSTFTGRKQSQSSETHHLSHQNATHFHTHNTHCHPHQYPFQSDPFHKNQEELEEALLNCMDRKADNNPSGVPVSHFNFNINSQNNYVSPESQSRDSSITHFEGSHSSVAFNNNNNSISNNNGSSQSTYLDDRENVELLQRLSLAMNRADYSPDINNNNNSNSNNNHHHHQHNNNNNLGDLSSTGNTPPCTMNASSDDTENVFSFLTRLMPLSLLEIDEDALDSSSGSDLSPITSDVPMQCGDDYDLVDLKNLASSDELHQIPPFFDPREFFAYLSPSPETSGSTSGDDISETDCTSLQFVQGSNFPTSDYDNPPPLDSYNHSHSPSNTDEGYEEGPPAAEETLPLDQNLPFNGNFHETIDSEAPSTDESSSAKKPRKRLSSLKQKKKPAAVASPPGERRKPGRKPGQVSNVLHLWEFMRDLLHDPSINKGIIEWISKPDGVFRVVNSSEVARLWGEKKNNKKAMTYEKLSRSLRYSRLEGYFANLPKDKNYPKKLCFKFGPKSKDWRILS